MANIEKVNKKSKEQEVNQYIGGQKDMLDEKKGTAKDCQTID